MNQKPSDPQDLNFVSQILTEKRFISQLHTLHFVHQFQK